MKESKTEKQRRNLTTQEKLISLDNDSSYNFHQLYSGIDSRTGEQLDDAKVVDLLKRHIDIVIEKSSLLLGYIQEKADLKSERRVLKNYKNFRKKGQAGLIDYCQAFIDSLPRDHDDESKVNARFADIAQRWEHYQEIIRTSV